VQVAGYIDQIIMFAVGVYGTSVGFGWLPSPAPRMSAEDWQRRYGRLFKVIGPLLIVVSLLLAIGQYARSSQGAG
jgi:hypothetical protein